MQQRQATTLLQRSPPPSTPTQPTQPTQPTAGPSTATVNAKSRDLWADILRSADRQKSLKRKNVILLSERHRGRRHLLDRLISSKRRALVQQNEAGALAMGFEILEADEGDEDAAPPVSVFYPPSSHPSLLRLVDVSLPPESLPNSVVVIVLDWSKPLTMVRELLGWLVWVDKWATRNGDTYQREVLRERLQAHLQLYTEPVAAPKNAFESTPPFPTPSLTSISTVGYGSLGSLLPLGPGTLNLNPNGVPIVVTCTRADLMDSVGEEIGMKGGGWEERTDWIQQVLRTICLSYGAALFYTAPTQPDTYKYLHSYLFHRLYSIPLASQAGSLDYSTTQSSLRFPFPHRANVLDRDAVMVPAGWDSWGKINVVRDGFDPARVGRAWDASINRLAGGEDDEEGIEDFWLAMIPDTEQGPRGVGQSTVTTTSEPEQVYLARQLDVLLKDPNRDPRASFRAAAASASTASGTTAGDGLSGSERSGGVVGPMGSGGLSLPGVEKAMAEMEGTADDIKDRFARIARREPTRGGPSTSSTGDQPAAVPNEALHNFFQGLLAKKTSGPSGTPAKAAK